MTKLKVYVWKGSACWWGEVAPIGRERIDGLFEPDPVDFTMGATQPEALARGLALLDEVCVGQLDAP